MRRSAVPALLILSLAGCSSAPEPAAAPAPAAQPKAAAPKRVKDHQATLIQEGLLSSRLVPDHILDHPKLPGGSLGEYEKKGKKYQLFVVDADTNQAAAFLLFDVKNTLQTPEYISYMGGYFGSDGKQPVYVFAKLQYLAGVVGLSKDDADPIARVLASRLR
ncbi:MAG TPA: hypothetical protein VNH18_21155 [Bryobacteraceae bacterium]|nr:hypothetical protein [Bryobacteraceae bacterium]